MKALVFRDIVVQMEDKTFPVHKNMTWMDAPPACEVGWILKDGTLQKSLDNQIPKEQKVRCELPSYDERIDALWDIALKGDNTKVLEVEAKIQAVYDKHNVPRG